MLFFVDFIWKQISHKNLMYKSVKFSIASIAVIISSMY